MMRQSVFCSIEPRDGEWVAIVDFSPIGGGKITKKFKTMEDAVVEMQMAGLEVDIGPASDN